MSYLILLIAFVILLSILFTVWPLPQVLFLNEFFPFIFWKSFFFALLFFNHFFVCFLQEFYYQKQQLQDALTEQEKDLKLFEQICKAVLSEKELKRVSSLSNLSLPLTLTHSLFCFLLSHGFCHCSSFRSLIEVDGAKTKTSGCCRMWRKRPLPRPPLPPQHPQVVEEENCCLIFFLGSPNIQCWTLWMWCMVQISFLVW